MRRFGTQGRRCPELHYGVPRTEEIAEFITRVKEGRYIVLFAPRQTAKAPFFHLALYADCTPSEFYEALNKEICKEIRGVFQKRGEPPAETLCHF